MADKRERKTYTVAQIKEEFFQEFPELKNKVKIIDPRDYDGIDAIIADVRPDFQEEAKMPGQNPMIATMRENMLRMVLKMGAPVAMMLGVDPHAETIGGSKRLVFGGNEDLSFDTLVWRGLSPGTANLVAQFSKDFEEKLQEKVKGTYYLPPELNDPNILQSFVLDHELGHAATAHMIKQTKALTHDVPQYWECIADSYALIRHYQRYGEDSQFGEYWTAFRSSAAVMVPDPVHWTAEAMEKVMDLNKQGKIKDLTPKQAIELAVKIADECGFGLDESPNIAKAFGTSPLKAAFVESVGKGVVNTLKDLWKKSKNPEIIPVEEPANDKEEGLFDGFQKSFFKQCTDRLDNKDNTVRKIGDIALKTESSAVYRVAKDFVNTVERIWPELDAQKLAAVKKAVNSRSDVPKTEPGRSAAERMAHEMKTKHLRNRKFGNGS